MCLACPGIIIISWEIVGCQRLGLQIVSWEIVGCKNVGLQIVRLTNCRLVNCRNTLVNLCAVVA